jgi:hypothetical protein
MLRESRIGNSRDPGDPAFSSNNSLGLDCRRLADPISGRRIAPLSELDDTQRQENQKVTAAILGSRGHG